MQPPAADEEEEAFGNGDEAEEGVLLVVSRRTRQTPPPPGRRQQAHPLLQAAQPPSQSRQRQALELQQQQQELLHQHRLQQQQQHQQPSSRRSPISSLLLFSLTIAALFAGALLLSAAYPSAKAHLGFPASPSSSPPSSLPPSDPSSSSSSVLPPGAIPLWPVGRVPLANGLEAKDTPLLIPYYPDESKWAGLSVVIMPGGGYRFLSIDKEGRDVARWLCEEEGIAAFVLQYRLGPDGYHHPTQLLDGRRSVKKARALIKERYQGGRREGGRGRELLGEAAAAEEGKVGVMGFSAGGHLSASVLAHPEEDELTKVEHIDDTTETYSARPDFGLLIYPVISMEADITHRGSKGFLLPSPTPNLTTYYSIDKQVSPPSLPPSLLPSFPPTFLYHSQEDKTVSVDNSIRLAAALRTAGLDHDFCYFDNGKHGMGMGVKDGVRHPWTRLALAFLRREDLLREGGGEDAKKGEVPREDGRKKKKAPWGRYICTGIP